MPLFADPLTVGSADLIRVYCEDVWTDHQAKRKREAPVDLSFYSSIVLQLWYYVEGSGYPDVSTAPADLEFTLTVDPDQSDPATNPDSQRGYATFQLDSNSITTAGLVVARVVATDGAAKPHKSELFYDRIQA